MTDYALYHARNKLYDPVQDEDSCITINVHDWDNQINTYVIPVILFNREDFEYFVKDAWQGETEYFLSIEWTSDHDLHVKEIV